MLEYTERTVKPTGLGIDVSIVIVSFNTCEVLRACLESVQREIGALSAEIMVVDNASTDGSAEMVAAEFPEVILFRSDTNLGFGAANNVALEKATGRYHVLLNSDAFFEPGALHLAIQHMDATPDCGLGGARLIGRDGAWQPSARTFHSIAGDLVVMTGLAGQFPKNRFFGDFDRTWADSMEAASVDWVPGAFCIARPEVLAKVGLFDPAFFLYYEEVDLCKRIKDAGYSIWYWPDVVVVHWGGESSKRVKTLAYSSMAAQVVMWRMRSMFLYYRKHHDEQAWLAKEAEGFMYRLTIVRNRFASTQERKDRGERYKVLLALLEQAWKDTRGGRFSPPRPW